MFQFTNPRHDALDTHPEPAVRHGAVPSEVQIPFECFLRQIVFLDALQQQIEIGGRRFGTVEVKRGLEEGDRIVIEGIVKLSEGIEVRLDEAAGAVSERSREQHGPPRSGVRG